MNNKDYKEISKINKQIESLTNVLNAFEVFYLGKKTDSEPVAVEEIIKECDKVTDKDHIILSELLSNLTKSVQKLIEKSKN